MKYYEFSHQLGVPQINTVKLQDKIFGIECNFEELNGIDFSKGCYVGQENTARMKLRNKVRRRLFPLSVCKELSLDGEILYNEKKVGKILINKPFPFALIKLFDPDLVEFANKDLSSNNSKIKLIRSSFYYPSNYLYMSLFLDIEVKMSNVKSDIEIARNAKIKPIKDVLSKFNIPDDPFSFSPMGRHIAKLNLEYISTLKRKKVI